MQCPFFSTYGTGLRLLVSGSIGAWLDVALREVPFEHTVPQRCMLGRVMYKRPLVLHFCRFLLGMSPRAHSMHALTHMTRRCADLATNLTLRCRKHPGFTSLNSCRLARLRHVSAVVFFAYSCALACMLKWNRS